MQTITFTPNSREVFTFTVEINGETFYASTPYNHYDNRYYVQLKNGNNEVVTYVPMIASPDGYDINLALAFAPGLLVYRASSNNFEAK